ncbi:hypothetical protein Tco_0435854 [Tanacetum coccineum]
MSGSQDEIPPPPPPPLPSSSSQTPTQQTPHTVSTIKLPILKKGEYDIWAMKMEHYLAHTYYPIWEVIQNGNDVGCRGNDESKKMQKYILKQQFEGFFVSNSEGLHKGYNRFQSLLSQLEIHRAGVSTKDANKKFLRSLPSAWSQVSLITRTKPGVNSLSFDDLTNDVSIAYSVSNTYGQNSQLDEFDLEEMGLKWQVAMISIRMKKFYKKTGHFARECKTKGNQDSRRRDAWNSGNKDGRRSEEAEDYALMACNSSSSNTEVTSCLNECKESYVKLKKLYDAQREHLSDASIEIKAYTQGLKKVEAQFVAHQQGQLWYKETIRFMKIYLDDKTDILTYHKKLFAEAQKEKEDLKAKVEK